MNRCTYTPVTGETVYRVEHPSGLSIYVYPKKGYRTTYAMFSTRYGSVDSRFEVNGEVIEVPAGIAHYLEHKLFENEDCDAFARYAQTGANANAFTSFDVTAYLFSCSDHLEESLEILLDFVQKPYFTEQTVQKEQGIIGQEIRMCEDSPERRVMFNLFEAMYHTHPVRIDIAGTVESIAQITPQLLYDCYATFYNLHNMVLTVCGDVTVEQVMKVADKVLIPAKPQSLKTASYDEPKETAKRYTEQIMPVAAPLFYVGYKLSFDGEFISDTEAAASEIAVEMLSGAGSALYTELMEDGLINDSFGGEFYEGRGFAMVMFGGESKDPQAVYDRLTTAIAQVRENGVDGERFEELRRAAYGQLIRRFNNVESAATVMMDDHFHGREPFSMIDTLTNLTADDVAAAFDRLRAENSTLSVVKGKEEA